MDIFFIILIFIISTSVVLFYLYLYLRYRDRALGFWMLAGVLFVFEFLLDMSYNHGTKYEMPLFIQLLDWYLIITGSFLMLWGTYSLLDITLPGACTAAFLTMLALEGLNIYFFHEDFLILVSLFGCTGGLAWAGIILCRSKPKMKVSYITGVLLMFWGANNIYLASQTNVRQPTWISSWGYLFEVILAVASMIGLLMLFLERKSQQDKSMLKFLPYFFHEIKTPLMIIHGYAESIREGVFPEGSLEKSAEAISGEAEQLEKRIKDLLYLEKLDKSFAEPKNYESIDLAQQINICVNRFRWRRAEVSWDINIMPLIIWGQREQWGVVLDNLIDNQLRYAEKRIRISVKLQQDSQKAILRIWNDGPPIDQEIKEEIFTAYRTGAGGNFGLGLAIARRIVENHRGKIWVENEEGGPAFFIKISYVK